MRSKIYGRKQMEKRTTNYDKDPLPAGDSVLAIETLDPEGQETREGAGERGDAKQHGEADLHGMALVESRKEEHHAGEEAT
jgi:hypothetical protein